MARYDENALFSSALATLIDRAGGEVEFTQTEYAAIKARRGEYVMQGEVDKSGPGEPVIRIRLIPSSKKGSMPVA